MGQAIRERKVTCPDCRVRMRLLGKARLRYICPACKGSLSADANGKPRGVPATLATRQWRRRAHTVFDRLWRQSQVSRSAAQRWLAAELGIATRQCHFSYMDGPMLKRVVKLCDAVAEGELAGPLAADENPKTSHYRRMAHEAARLLRRAGAHPTALRYWIAHHTGADAHEDIGGLTSVQCKRLIRRCNQVFFHGARPPRGVKLNRKLKLVALPKFRRYLDELEGED